MTQPTPPTSKLRSFVKWGFISLFLIAAIWFVVIIWWQTTQRVVSLEDALLYLLVLPLGLLFSIGLIQLVRHLVKKRSAARVLSQSQRTTSGNNSSADGMTTTEVERALKLSVLSAWGVTSLADNAEALVQALLEKRSRPRPDALLLDERGFPLPSGRAMNLNTEAVQERLMQLVATNGFDHIPDSDEWRHAFVRALALLAQVLEQAKTDWPFAHDAYSDSEAEQAFGTLRGAPATHFSPTKPLGLHVKLLLSVDFRPYEKQLALAYLLEALSTFQIPAKLLHVEIVSAQDDATALALVDQFNLRAHRDAETQALLLLACDSTLCPTVTDNWHSKGQLFSTHCPNGLMMGEAAYGVLCASEKALLESDIEPACQLARVAMETRELSADTPGKPSSVCLTKAVGDALTLAGITGEKIGTVACDADHRTNRTLECMGAMMHQTPQLDAIENRLATNEACGHTGAASVLGVLVAGVTKAKNDNHPVLIFNVSHMAQRAAVVLMPIGETPQTS